MAQTAHKVEPVTLGTDTITVQRLSQAVANTAMAYRFTPNTPEARGAKERAWNLYQECIAELMEAIHG